MIRQECSRVAHRMDNLEKYVPAGEGVTEEMVCSNHLNS